MSRFYLTTAIDYVNNRPHLGTAYEKIAADQRHTDVLVLSEHEEVEDRQFPSWAMKKVDLDEGALSRLEPIKALLDAIVVQRESMQQLMRVLSRSVWQELMENSEEKS